MVLLVRLPYMAAPFVTNVPCLHRHCIHLRLLLLDLRNHGASSQLPGLHPPHSVEAAAGDVLQVMRELLPR